MGILSFVLANQNNTLVKALAQRVFDRVGSVARSRCRNQQCSGVGAANVEVGARYAGVALVPFTPEYPQPGD
jgi:hypothetical protein